MAKIFGAKWWEAIGVSVAVIGLLVTIITVFFTDVPAVLPSEPEYPGISLDSQCQGDWVYTEYQECPDKSKPITETITDGDICGYTTVTELDSSITYKECRDTSHGLAGYASSNIVEQWSGWRKGGYDQRSWCNELQARTQQSIGQPIKWEIIETRERKKEEFPRRFYYKYFCKAKAQWMPIYNVSRSPACGREAPRAINVEIADSCINPNAPIKYRSTRRKECGTTESRTFIPDSDRDELIKKVNAGEVSWHKCLTCDDLSSSPNDYAECLISSAYYYMELSDTAGMKNIKSRLVARKSNPNGIERKTRRRVKHQLLHLKEAL